MFYIIFFLADATLLHTILENFLKTSAQSILPNKTGHFVRMHFLIRMAFKDIYL